ncbi:hypothetical protein BDN70DRAFT_406362 [Pholiota conissans]|uniref:Uncharacterized protein n=1 Tax=Pholiota conissans TaxID=109636 RepID=A0A9P6CN74_9AGAR|nr:hypothetical protein BDN70DRAFT_406362 [Pholiota conissans]
MVTNLDRQLRGWSTTWETDQERSTTERNAYLAQIESMKKEIIDLKSQVERFQNQHYHWQSNSNPLPAPPRPVLTPNLPSFEQALLESGVGARNMDLPSSPTPHPRFEVETHKRSKRRSHLAEQQYPNSTYDESRFQQGSSRQSRPADPSQYVQAHIKVPARSREPSPRRHSKRAQPPADDTEPALDVFTITQAYLEEYSNGFQNGHQAATGSHNRRESNRNRYPNGHPVAHPVSAYEPVDARGQRSAPIYANYPHSAPAAQESSSRHRPDRRHTAQSSIVSSGSSPAGDRSSSRSRSRSRSSGAHGALFSAQDLQLANAQLGSLLLGSEALPEPASAPMIRPPSLVRTPPPRAPEVEPPPANTRPRSPGGQSAHSRRTLDSGSWGTQAPSHLTDGSLIPGLSFFRSETRPDRFEGGQEVRFHPLNSDGESIRTRQMSISSMTYEESAGHVSHSPPRPIESMVGVMPGLPRVDEIHPGAFRHARSDGQIAAHSVGWNPNVHASRAASSSTHVHQSGSALSLSRSIHEERSRSDYVNPVARDHESRGNSHSASGYPIAGSSRYSEGPPPAQRGRDRDRRAAMRTNSDDNVVRHAQRRPWLNPQALPESPSDPSVGSYIYGSPYSYSSQQERHDSRLVGHAEPENAPPSFMGNALGLEMSASNLNISAPTPIQPSPLLRSWSQDH